MFFKNPIYDFGILVVTLSQYIETGKFISFSISPCLKNSSHNKFVHFKCNSAVLALCPRSAHLSPI
jgi:hypothetical protein